MTLPTIKQELVGTGMTDDESDLVIDSLELLGFTEPRHFDRLYQGLILQHHQEGNVAARSEYLHKLLLRVVNRVPRAERAQFVGLRLQDKIVQAMKGLLEAHYGGIVAAPQSGSKPIPFNFSVDGETSITNLEVDVMVRQQRKFSGQSSELDLSDAVSFAAVKHCMRCIKQTGVQKGERPVLVYLEPKRGCTEFESRSRQRESVRPDASVISQLVAASTEDVGMTTDYSSFGTAFDQLTRFRLDVERVSIAWVTASSFFIPLAFKTSFQRFQSDVKMFDSSDGEEKYIFGTLRFTTLLMGRFSQTRGILSSADVEPAIRMTYAAVGTELSQGLMLNSAMKEALRNTSHQWQMIRGAEAPPTAAETRIAGRQQGGNEEILEYLKQMAQHGIGKTKVNKDKKLKAACPDFNKASGCKNKSKCPNGVHRCTKCKAGGHGATDCKK